MVEASPAGRQAARGRREEAVEARVRFEANSLRRNSWSSLARRVPAFEATGGAMLDPSDTPAPQRGASSLWFGVLRGERGSIQRGAQGLGRTLRFSMAGKPGKPDSDSDYGRRKPQMEVQAPDR